MAPGLVLLLVTLLTLSYSASAQDTRYVVRLAQVVHDHGVRSPSLTGQAATICGTDYPCGALSMQGMQMMAAVGDYVRTRYNNPDLAGTSFFPFTQYDQTLLSSLAADYSYTIQSAEAFISGVFSTCNYFFPVVLSTNHSTDLRISTEGLPAAMLKRDVDTAELERVLDGVIDDYFTWAQLQNIASTVSASALCPSAAQRGSCVRALYEIYRYLEAAGTLGSYPALAQARDGLVATRVAYGRYLFAYDADEPLDVARGSAGQPIAQELIRHMHDYAAATAPTSYKLYEYSADAGLLSALGATLGASDDATFAPAFGSAFIVELLQGTSDASYYVRVLRGSPVSRRPGVYVYQPGDFTQRCTAANGTTYVAAGNVCALDDFVRYVGASGPTATAGYCAVNETQYAMMQCPQSPSQPLPHFCALYRSVCPRVACPSGYVLSAADQRCYERVNGAGGGNYVVRLAQVLHRHGARSPAVTFNTTEICGTEYPCGYLNAQGMEMLRVVGDFVRNRYRDPSIVESSLLPTDTYNASLVYSRSTYYARTLQSASAFLHGLFPSNANFYPAIFTINLTKETFLNTDYVPPVLIRQVLDKEGLRKALNPIVDSLLTRDELLAAGRESFAEGDCLDVQDRYMCAYDLYDFATSSEATGKLADKPHLAAILPQLSIARTAVWRYLVDYDTSKVERLRQGGYAYMFASTLVANMRAHIVSPSYALFHYSSHDSMAAAFSATLGDRRDESFLPPYAVTHLIELLQNTDDGSYHVRILRGHPEEQGEPGRYSFVQTSFEQHCMYANGTTYIRDVCPLDDFARFVDSTKPTDPAGICVLEDDQVPLLQCPELGDYTTPVPQYCKVYRSLCPATSCPAGYDLNAADLRCYPGAPAAQGAILRSAP